MSDRPGPEERRRTGPLGDQGDTERTRRGTSDDGEATRRIPLGGSGEGRTGDDQAPTRRLRRNTGGDERTRVFRTPASGDTQEASPYPGGYYEAAEDREERLRDLYGGVDWLASFLGFVFAVVAGAFFSLVAGLVLGPLGFSLGIGGLDAAEITGLVVIGILIFLTWFFGGYVAGRLARFDGGLNGIMTVVWGLAVGALLLAVGPLLPGAIFELTQSFAQNTLSPTVDVLRERGLVGIAIIAGVLLVTLLGGFLGGRAGSRYHSDIDGTT